MCRSTSSNGKSKWQRGILSCPKIGRPECHLVNLRHNPFGSGSSHYWPLNLQISFSSKRARTVYGVTRPMGSNTEDTKLRTARCVTESLSSRLTPLLTTNVSVTGFSFKDKLGTLLLNFVRLNPPNLSSSTKLRLNVKAVSGFFTDPR